VFFINVPAFYVDAFFMTSMVAILVFLKEIAEIKILLYKSAATNADVKTDKSIRIFLLTLSGKLETKHIINCAERACHFKQ
jgi:hypothetical protein